MYHIICINERYIMYGDFADGVEQGADSVVDGVSGIANSAWDGIKSLW